MSKPINFKEYFGFLDYSKSEFDRNSKRVPTAREMEGVYLSKDFEIGSFPGSVDIIDDITNPIYHQTILLNRNVRIPIFYADDGTTGTWYYYNPDTKLKTSIGTVTGGGQVQAEQYGDKLVLASTNNIPKIMDLAYSLSSFSNYPPTYTADTSTVQTVNTGDSVVAHDKPGIIASFQNRLWFLYRGKLYFSQWGNLDGWTDAVDNTQKASLYEFNNNFGDGVQLFVLDETLCIVFEDGIIGLTGEHPIDEAGNNPFRTYIITSEYGTKSPNSFIQKGGSVLFLNNKKKYVQISKAQNAGGVQLIASPADNYISKPIQKDLDLIPDETLPYVHATDIEHKGLIALAFYKGFCNFPIDDNTRALFTLDSLVDKGRTGYILTSNGTVSSVSSFNNLLSSAKKFNGTNGYLRNNNSAGSNAGLPYDEFTLRAWIKPTALPSSGNKAYIYHENSVSGNFSIYLHNDGGTHKVVGALEGNTVCEVEYQCPLTSWTYIAFKWDGTELTVYVNDETPVTESGNTLDVNGSDGIAIAAKYDGGASDYFNGTIACINVEDIAMEEEDIDTHYAEVSTSPNRIAFYDYDRGGWAKVTDSIKAMSSLYINGRWFTGTVDGKIKEQLQGYTQDIASSDIREFRYRPERFNLGKGFKGFEKIEFTLEDFGTGVLYFEFVWNKETPNIVRKEILITDDLGDEVEGRKKKFEIYPRGGGEWLDFTIHGAKDNFPFKITSMIGYPR